LPDTSGTFCRTDAAGDEDVELGKCLEGVNVSAVDTRDAVQQPRFIAVNPGANPATVSYDASAGKNYNGTSM
jgi:hypothetical protein